MKSKYSIVFLGKGMNYGGWDYLIQWAEEHGVRAYIFERHEEVTGTYDLGILLGYNRIIPSCVLECSQKGFLLFHSSDLPQGRGWAPIYYTIFKGLPLVQTMLYASERVDQGKMIAKAFYELSGAELENEVRLIDDVMTRKLLDECLLELLQRNLEGRAQDESDATWWARRHPVDSEIDINKPLAAELGKIRGLPSSAPAYFQSCGRKFYITLSSDEKLPFNEADIRIEKYYRDE
jgi:methionyl-tRNA formyltransferase